ncbi:MAG: hypothetical protein ACRESJ_17690 [Pseudomonas sp.]|uniref:hypothetical protein n=1 Tax=Pseudomonas sp. TaxID=306 RepID=UPI003D6E2FC9
MLLTTSHSSLGFVPPIPKPYARPPCSHQGGVAAHSTHAQHIAVEIVPYLRLPSRWLDRLGLVTDVSQHRAQARWRHADDQPKANDSPRVEPDEASAEVLLS